MTDIEELDALFQEEPTVAEPENWNDTLDALGRLVPAHRVVFAVFAALVAVGLYSLVWTPVTNQVYFWLYPPENVTGFITVAVPSLAVVGVTLFFAAIAGGLAFARQFRARYTLLVPLFAFSALLFVAVMELSTGKSLVELLPL